MIYPIRKYLNIAEQKADFFFFFFWWIKPNGEHFYCFHCSSNPIDLAKWIFHIPFCRQHLFKLMVAASSVVLLAYKFSSFTRSYHCYCRCWFFWTRTIIPLVVVDIQFHFHWNHFRRCTIVNMNWKERKIKITPSTVFFWLSEVTSVTTITS